jgi:hypothetical protein
VAFDDAIACAVQGNHISTISASRDGFRLCQCHLASHISLMVVKILSRRRRWFRRIVLAVLLLTLLPVATGGLIRFAEGQVSWSDARRDSSGQSPDPADFQDAVVQVFAGRTWGWRGALGVHSWITAKRSGADHYVRYEVIGWGVRHGRSAVRVWAGTPDSYWFGSYPDRLLDLRGPDVDAVIDRIEAATAAYPYPDRYTVWPGPNSNTFTAFVVRLVPELRIDLPPTAVGKDYLGSDFVARTPSGTGFQVSLFGVAGMALALEEGLEFNLLRLNFGLDLFPPALKLPGLGRVGFP